MYLKYINVKCDEMYLKYINVKCDENLWNFYEDLVVKLDPVGYNSLWESYCIDEQTIN